MAKKKDENLEGKKPDDMTSEELEQTIKQQAEKSQEVVEEKPKEVKEEKKEEVKEEKKEEKSQPNWYDTFPADIQQLAKERGWKTQEEMFKSYRDAEKGLSQQGEKISRLEKRTQEYQQHLSQIYDFDGEGNLIGYKVKPTQQMVSQTDQLAGLRPYFEGYTDEQIMSLIGLNALMINTFKNQFKEEIMNELKPVYEMKFEREVEIQKNEIKVKYQDYNDFSAEVDEKLKLLPPEIRSRKGSVETIFLTVRGEHLPDVVEKVRQGVLKETQKIEEKKEETFVEGGGKSSVATPPVDVGKMSLDELEKHIKTLQK
jgi:hypothetical protein